MFLQLFNTNGSSFCVLKCSTAFRNVIKIYVVYTKKYLKITENTNAKHFHSKALFKSFQ